MFAEGLKLGYGGVSESKPRQNGFWYWRIILGRDVSIGRAGWRRGVVASARIWPEPYLWLRQECVGPDRRGTHSSRLYPDAKGWYYRVVIDTNQGAILFCPLLAGWWLFSLLSSIRGPSPRTLPPGTYDPPNPWPRKPLIGPQIWKVAQRSNFPWSLRPLEEHPNSTLFGASAEAVP